MTQFKLFTGVGFITFTIANLLLWENVFMTFSWLTLITIAFMTSISYVMVQVSLLPPQSDVDNLAWFAFLNSIVLAVGFSLGVIPGVYYLSRYSQSTWSQYRHGRHYGTVKLLRYTSKRTRNASLYYILQFIQLLLIEVAVFLVFSLVPMITGHWVLAWLLATPVGYYGLCYTVRETYLAWQDFEQVQ